MILPPAPPASESPCWRAEGDLVWLTCPTCRGRIEEPFSRYAFASPYAHCGADPPAPPCRLVVCPDPLGSDHEVLEVGPDETYQEVLDRAVFDQERLRNLIRFSALLACEHIRRREPRQEPADAG